MSDISDIKPVDLGSQPEPAPAKKASAKKAPAKKAPAKKAPTKKEGESTTPTKKRKQTATPPPAPKKKRKVSDPMPEPIDMPSMDVEQELKVEDEMKKEMALPRPITPPPQMTHTVEIKGIETLTSSMVTLVDQLKQQLSRKAEPVPPSETGSSVPPSTRGYVPQFRQFSDRMGAVRFPRR